MGKNSNSSELEAFDQVEVESTSMVIIARIINDECDILEKKYGGTHHLYNLFEWEDDFSPITTPDFEILPDGVSRLIAYSGSDEKFILDLKGCADIYVSCSKKVMPVFKAIKYLPLPISNNDALNFIKKEGGKVIYTKKVSKNDIN